MGEGAVGGRRCGGARPSPRLRVIASIRTGTMTASLIMRQLAAYRGRTGSTPPGASWDGSSALWQTLRQTEDVAEALLAHLSPLGWEREHVNLTGDYVWDTPDSVSENTGGLKSLRILPEPYARAA